MKIAVIGGGISGLGSAYLLGSKHEVHLFEAETRLGGHAHTTHIKTSHGSAPMDTGFLVYNEETYPHLVGLFKHLGVETVASDMSLSIKSADKNLEWSGTNLNTVFAQRRNFLRPRFLYMLTEILRFHREVHDNLERALRHAWTLGELLRARRFSSELANNYLLPMSAAIWSTPEQGMLDFPAATYLNFLINHKLVQVNDRPVWRTVKNGSESYVKKIVEKAAHIHSGVAIQSVERRNNKVHVKTPTDDLVFDKVIFATHAPTTFKLLKGQSELEHSVLSVFRVEANRAVLHQDPTTMPKRPLCWASWNVRAESKADKVTLTYHLNRLQPLATSDNYFLTLNPHQDPSNVVKEMSYDHPRFDQAAIRAQRSLPEIQGKDGIYFAGAWTRYGFHEDGLLSAVQVAQLFGIKPPWEVR